MPPLDVSALAGRVNPHIPPPVRRVEKSPTVKVEHKGYIIEVFSQRSGSGDKWRPDISVTLHSEAGVRTECPLTPKSFDTAAESDAFGVQHAKNWIDKRG